MIACVLEASVPQAECHPVSDDGPRHGAGLWVRLGMHRCFGPQERRPKDDNGFWVV